jgi:hypothetical protein
MGETDIVLHDTNHTNASKQNKGFLIIFVSINLTQNLPKLPIPTPLFALAALPECPGLSKPAAGNPRAGGV